MTEDFGNLRRRCVCGRLRMFTSRRSSQTSTHLARPATADINITHQDTNYTQLQLTHGALQMLRHYLLPYFLNYTQLTSSLNAVTLRQETSGL